MKVRGFEIANGFSGVELPKRSTKHSAGYDLASIEDIVIPAYKPGSSPVLVKTGIKAYFPNNEVLIIANRSSNPIKRNLIMPNGIGVIDADYYGNPDNDGQIYVQLYNIGNEDVLIKKGERIAQAIFQKFYITDNDQPGEKRVGGHGSTNK